jgi:DNA-directed RNA polymerase subunit E'/Rpb7
MDNLYTTNILYYRYHLLPEDFGSDPDEIFLAKLKREIEGRCISQGYVKTGSIKILSRSLGHINQAYFTGLPVYDIKYQAEICNPPIGSIIECIIKDETKMGLVCQVNDSDNPLDIVVPSQWHTDNKKYTMLEPEMKIKVKIARKRHESGDNNISVIASLYSTPFDSDKEYELTNSNSPKLEEETEEDIEKDEDNDDDEDEDEEENDDE